MKKVQYNKREQKLIDELLIGVNKEKVTNIFSGESCILEPLGVALYDFIIGSQVLLEKEQLPPKKAQNLSFQFDIARNLFRKLYPDEYMILID